MRAVHDVLLATTNLGKKEEFQTLFRPYGEFNILLASEMIRNADKIALVETKSTYMENAVAKARVANQGSHYPCLADDSGLEVQALEGAPGVHSHRYAIARAGQSQDDANIEKLLTALKAVPAEKRTARFVCSLALIVEGILITTTGTLEGEIIDTPRGTGGFGYDPIFVPADQQKTLAEMSLQEKNFISHRAVALKNLFEQINQKGIIFVKP